MSSRWRSTSSRCSARRAASASRGSLRRRPRPSAPTRGGQRSGATELHRARVTLARYEENWDRRPAGPRAGLQKSRTPRAANDPSELVPMDRVERRSSFASLSDGRATRRRRPAPRDRAQDALPQARAFRHRHEERRLNRDPPEATEEPNGQAAHASASTSEGTGLKALVLDHAGWPSRIARGCRRPRPATPRAVLAAIEKIVAALGPSSASRQGSRGRRRRRDEDRPKPAPDLGWLSARGDPHQAPPQAGPRAERRGRASGTGVIRGKGARDRS